MVSTNLSIQTIKSFYFYLSFTNIQIKKIINLSNPYLNHVHKLSVDSNVSENIHKQTCPREDNNCLER